MDVDRSDLERLVAARGPPGEEYEVASVFEELIEPYVDEIQWDPMGNVIATCQGNADSDRREVLLAAHTDELAFLVDEITEDGLLSFTMMGGHYRGYQPGQVVRVGPNQVPGVIATKPRHFMDEDEKDELPETLHIDVGATTREEAKTLGIEPGDHATWDRELTDLANDRLAGRALDDRCLLAALVAIARETDVDRTVHFAATVQEEVGLRGARAVAADVDPDVAVALEIFPTDDYPVDGERSSTTELGSGPVVEIADGTSEYLFGGLLVDRQTREWLGKSAETADVEIQHDVMIGGSTDSTEFQRASGARHAGAIAVPCRYTHSPVETIEWRDLEELTTVLASALATEFPERTAVRGRSDRPD